MAKRSIEDKWSGALVTYLCATILCVASMVSALALAQDSPQVQRMRACNDQAGDLSGDERKALMKSCLSAPSTPATSTKSSASRVPGQDPAHRRGICGEIKKLDLLLYDDPRLHAPTARCSYTDSWLLVTPRTALPPDRMKRFVLLAYATAGHLFNEDFALPDKVYAGFQRAAGEA